MAQHTPGPWKAAGGSVLAAGGEPVAIVAAKAFPQVGEIGHANARLIASAPDLLAALEAIMVQAVAGDMEDRWEEECAAAHAAIAKAKGAD